MSATARKSAQSTHGTTTHGTTAHGTTAHGTTPVATFLMAATAGLLLLAAGGLLAGCGRGPGAGPGPGPGPGPEPGSRFRDCDECPLLVAVPAGSFTMGSPANEAGRDDDEMRRQVTVAAFAAGVHEVTFAQWDACVDDGGCNGHRPDDGGWGRGSRPVIDVNWTDAQAYAAWLSRTTGKTYRLLTEQEWEYAARAGTATPFHTGATIGADQANYDGRTAYADGAAGEYRQRTLPVGAFPANRFGLYDVHGNVAEMVADCYDAGSANGNDCARRVVRGGSWGDAPQFLRAAYRGWCGPALRNLHNGFRVARALGP